MTPMLKLGIGIGQNDQTLQMTRFDIGPQIQELSRNHSQYVSISPIVDIS